MSDFPAPRGQKYLPFQKIGIQFLAERTSALLADEQGLGKTVQAIGALNVLKAKRVLIGCPASVKYNWPSELKNWLTEYRSIQVIEGINAYVDQNCEITVFNYDLVSRGEGTLRALLGQRWDVGIFDEAHYLKSHKSERTKSILRRGGLASLCARKWFLSGTPVLNRPIELYPILKAAAPETITPYTDRIAFARQYCGAWWDGLSWVVDGSSNETELRHKLYKTFMLRRLKSEVLAQLPEKRFKVVPVGVDKGKGSKALDQERETLEQIEAGCVSLELGGIPIAMHRREVAEAKVETCLKYIVDELETVQKLVVFAHHKNVIQALERGLASYHPCVVNGDVSPSDRAIAVEAFQKDPERRVFIGQIQAAGTGITLTTASDVIFVESSWVPGEILQATDRLHRIGQRNAVQVTFLVAQGSVEEYMIHRVVDKLKTINKIVEKTEC